MRMIQKGNTDLITSGAPVASRPRPAWLRALGHSEPPSTIVVDGEKFQLVKRFKHDSWAATSLYANGDRKIVCKINRLQSIFVMPMGWLGRWLARRELDFLSRMSGVPGVPRCFTVNRIDGRLMTTAAAHDFVEGESLSRSLAVPDDFFDHLERLLQEMHRRRIAYIDLHKPENILVGTDGRPHLVDFQISVRLPDRFGFRTLFQMLADSDLYHLQKHRRRFHVRAWHLVPIESPWWIKAHRALTKPVRNVRRKILVWLGIRKGQGQATTELAPELGLRRPTE
jgi:serine/threonine protein kinase